MAAEKRNRLVHGVGINDADYVTGGWIQDASGSRKKWMCPIYRTWSHMLERCYCKKHLQRAPSYRNCSVVSGWNSFSAFRRWMLSQEWEGMDLDKDILLMGNKIYSPETCVFVSRQLNGFLTDVASARGDWPIGVSFSKEKRKFKASCRNPFSGKQETLGYYACPNDAHEAWRRRKRQIANQYANMQKDQRIAEALRARYE